MQIFMSWSGDKSRTFAEVLKPWLEVVLPGTDVWLSSEDIDKGTVWFTEIIGRLESCNCGVICITRENHLSPWIHFEAGGMVKGLGKGRVAAILLDMEYSELHQPLSLFNALRLNRQGAWQLVKSFNKASGGLIKDRVIERTFDKFWPDLDRDYQILFPDAHKASQEAQPLHIVPKPTEMLISTLAPGKRKRRKSEQQDQMKEQPGLFNGAKEQS